MISLVIQAGGESRRMGQDKALLPFLGRPLILRVIERLAPMADEVLVTTNRPESYAFLNLPLVSDLLPGRGALGGLYTALASARHPLVAVAACDMPFANPALFALERDCLLNEGMDVALPQSAEGFEPLHAVYRRETCLPAIHTALDAGQMKMIAWFPQVRVRPILLAEMAALDPAGQAFINVNTPEELALAEAMARNAP